MVAPRYGMYPDFFLLEHGAAMAVEYANFISLHMHGDYGFMHSWENCRMAMNHPPD